VSIGRSIHAVAEVSTIAERGSVAGWGLLPMLRYGGRRKPRRKQITVEAGASVVRRAGTRVEVVHPS
jgi:hypothetical protein